uniref:Uncharacterized protein n=1 Tax=Ditylenchus dipsaci TaxID=166011 RepID=A0A915EQZ7_9BILA
MENEFMKIQLKEAAKSGTKKPATHPALNTETKSEEPESMPNLKSQEVLSEEMNEEEIRAKDDAGNDTPEAEREYYNIKEADEFVIEAVDTGNRTTTPIKQKSTEKDGKKKFEKSVKFNDSPHSQIEEQDRKEVEDQILLQRRESEQHEEKNELLVLKKSKPHEKVDAVQVEDLKNVTLKKVQKGEKGNEKINNAFMKIRLKKCDKSANQGDDTKKPVTHHELSRQVKSEESKGLPNLKPLEIQLEEVNKEENSNKEVDILIQEMSEGASRTENMPKLEGYKEEEAEQTENQDLQKTSLRKMQK